VTQCSPMFSSMESGNSFVRAASVGPEGQPRSYFDLSESQPIEDHEAIQELFSASG